MLIRLVVVVGHLEPGLPGWCPQVRAWPMTRRGRGNHPGPQSLTLRASGCMFEAPAETLALPRALASPERKTQVAARFMDTSTDTIYTICTASSNTINDRIIIDSIIIKIISIDTVYYQYV